MYRKNSEISLHDLLKISKDLDKEITYLEKELKDPQELVLKSQDPAHKNKAEIQMQSISKDVLDLKNQIQSENEDFKLFSEMFEEDFNKASSFLSGINQEIKELETNFQKYGYVPYESFITKDEANKTDLSHSLMSPNEELTKINHRF